MFGGDGANGRQSPGQAAVLIVWAGPVYGLEAQSRPGAHGRKLEHGVGQLPAARLTHSHWMRRLEDFNLSLTLQLNPVPIFDMSTLTRPSFNNV